MLETPGRPPVARLAVSIGLTAYVGFWLVFIAVAAVFGGLSAGGPHRSFVLAEAGALARLRTAVAAHDEQAAAWLDSTVGQVLSSPGPQLRAERWIWLGETGRLQLLEVELQAFAAEDQALSRAISRLYLEPPGPDGPSPSPELAELLGRTRGYFHQAALARSGDHKAQREQQRQGERLLWLVGLFGGLLITLALLGVGLLLSVWFWLDAAHPAEAFPPPSPGPFPLSDVYLVFVAWLALYFTLSLAAGALPFASRWPVPFVVLTYLGHALGGWALLHRILAPSAPAGELLRSLCFGPRPLGLPRTLLFALGGYAVALPTVYGAGLLMERLVGEAPISENPLIPIILDSASFGDRLLLLLTVSILAPIFEELLFRGVLLSGLRRSLGPAPAILLSGLLFGAIHMDLRALVPLMALGCILGLVAHRSGSLVPAILVHAVWNAQSFVQLELLKQFS